MISIETYALLDSGSDNTQITKTVADALGICEGKSVTIPVASLYQEHTIETSEIFLGIGALDSSRPIINLLVFTTSTTDFQMPTVPIQMLNNICNEFSHLSGINFPHIRDNRIGILIEANAFPATVPLKYTTGPPGTPYGVLTQLGWTITGPVPNKFKQNIEKNHCNRNIILFNRFKSEEKTLDEDLLQFFWTCEGMNSSKTTPNTMNQENKKALQIFEDTVKHNGERFEIGLPWKDKVELPNNYFLLRTQLRSLEKRLNQDKQLAYTYNSLIQNDILKVTLTKQIESFHQHAAKYGIFLIIQYSTNKKKIRRMTNAASTYKGHSLNKVLLTGPDLLCNLVRLLLRFRQFAVAVTGDIAAMFMQIAVRKEDQDALRFLWYKDNAELINNYKRLIFGATCSPSCAIYVLQKCAIDNQLTAPEASRSILNNFYMDDFLQSFKTTEDAIKLTTCIKETLTKGGFNLTKFISNDSSFPLNDSSEEHKTSTQRVLGQTWDVNNDTFIFRKSNVDIKIEGMQQRQLLSISTSIFDPLGMITPFAIRIRSLLQAVVKQGKKWDQEIPAEFHSDLQIWIYEFNNMPDVGTKRCLVSQPNTSQQLHVFTEASNIATSSVIYMRCTTTEGKVLVNYVISKSRVAPIKQASTPKLELEAATRGAQLVSFLVSEMTLKISSVHFWTDSTATLGWTKSNKRQKRFVANRVKQILEHSNAQDWKHISGNFNPADHGTRGLKPAEDR
ncbi:uncharacterized protein LOC142358417 [Convolutriloba macropyga]|uniref:uncharacterized protein LOC142358417 n=1 Tax=Convolutriloba macropyga TaxID=536237 RepID=UPI003F5266E7